MTSNETPQYLTLIFCDLSLEERQELIYNSKLRASSWGHAINQRIYRDVMLDQLSQAAETLRDCWIERTGLTIEDDPYVKDACSVIESIRAERLSGKD
jgi:hypothetical protein